MKRMRINKKKETHTLSVHLTIIVLAFFSDGTEKSMLDTKQFLFHIFYFRGTKTVNDAPIKKKCASKMNVGENTTI